MAKISKTLPMLSVDAVDAVGVVVGFNCSTAPGSEERFAAIYQHITRGQFSDRGLGLAHCRRVLSVACNELGSGVFRRAVSILQTETANSADFSQLLLKRNAWACDIIQCLSIPDRIYL